MGKSDPRKLAHSEKVIGMRHGAEWFLGGEKARDRADAKRQIEGLSQNDQIIALLSELVTEQRRTNQLLEWLGGLLAQPRP
jgi:hypothetical protein